MWGRVGGSGGRGGGVVGIVMEVEGVVVGVGGGCVCGVWWVSEGEVGGVGGCEGGGGGGGGGVCERKINQECIEKVNLLMLTKWRLQEMNNGCLSQCPREHAV